MTAIAPHYWKKRKNAWPGFLKRDLYLVKTPGWMKRLYKGCEWDIQGEEKTLYLTFDDGPHPEITPFILSQLATYNAKACFFCIGDNVLKHPGVYQQILNEGHFTGNHTMHHVNGWKLKDEVYLADINDAANCIDSDLFRPPYGRIKRSQVTALKKQMPGSRIIMWNILAGDWEAQLSPEKCLHRVLKKTRNNDIIVFHDSEKAWPRVQHALPGVLKYFTEKGFRFGLIPGA
jgi:peptidoglycan-N-acetylglucosamine deacetylase